MKIAFIVLYLVVTIAMIAFIMLQRGSGAAAGSGFGSGASGTVFGARGSSNFLSKATKWLAVAFFLLALGMGVYEARVGIIKDPQADLGVMGQLPDAATPPAASEVPEIGVDGAAPAATTEIPTAPAAATEAPSEVPAAAESSSQTSETAAENASKEDEKPQ
jgi:preprotein translocase subunit SecG